MEEYLRVLAYPKFQLDQKEIEALLYREILPFFEVVKVKAGQPYVLDDPEDDTFIWCALSGRAEMIISGDTQLLSLQKPPLPVYSAKAFLRNIHC